MYLCRRRNNDFLSLLNSDNIAVFNPGSNFGASKIYVQFTLKNTDLLISNNKYGMK